MALSGSPMTVAFDAEKTLFNVEGLDWLAERKHGPKIGAEVARITNGGMSGASFRDSLSARLGIIGEVTPADWSSLTDHYLRVVNPGARESIRTSQEARAKVCIISGGFRQALLGAAEEMGVPREHVHALDYDPARNFPHDHALLENTGKATVFLKLVKDDLDRYTRGGQKRPRNFMIGDGSTDAAVRHVPLTAFFSVGDRPKVRAAADVQLETLQDFPDLFLSVLSGEMPLPRVDMQKIFPVKDYGFGLALGPTFWRSGAVG